MLTGRIAPKRRQAPSIMHDMHKHNARILGPKVRPPHKRPEESTNLILSHLTTGVALVPKSFVLLCCYIWGRCQRMKERKEGMRASDFMAADPSIQFPYLDRIM